MLKITIPAVDEFDDDRQVFIESEEVTMELEHSLISLSKWEAIWEKPFLSHEQHTDEQALSYIQMMTLTPNIAPDVYQRLTDDNLQQINAYINAKMSATWFTDKAGPRNRDIITAEVIYHWMFSASIALECENWHLNKLFTLIKVFNEKNSPEKNKMNKKDLLKRNRELNAQRQAQHNTSG